MSYQYTVVWFEKEKIWLKGSPRTILTRCKMFRSLEKAKMFQKDFVKPYPNIYKLLKEEKQ